MLSREFINRKFDLIVEDIQSLRRFAQLDIEAYLEKPENEVLAERYLERIINRLIDVNYHIVKEVGGYAPTGYSESFRDMGQLKILPNDFAYKLVDVGGFRNILVHDYDEIDESQVYANIKACLEDVPKYMKCVKDFLDTHYKP